MTKSEFLKKLKKKIDILEESEVEDILKDYEGFIDEKINQGMSESDAVSSLGNLDEITEELLSAYKIKKTPNKSENIINHFVNQIIDIIEKIIYAFSHKSLREIIRFMFEIVGIFLILFLCKIPFEIIISLGKNVLYDLCTSIGGYSFYEIVSGIAKFFIEMIYLIFAIILFIKLFENRYKNSDFFDTKEMNRNVPKKKNEVIKESENKSKAKEIEHEGLSILDILVNICMFIIKSFVFFVLIWVIFYIVGMTAAVGISIYLFTLGITYIGFYLGILSLLILGICIFLVLFNFIFNRKNNLVALFFTTLGSLIFLGIGIGIATIEVAQTQIVYDTENNQNLEVQTFEYPMKENLVLHNFGTNYKIDDSLNDLIRVEYKYNPDFVDYHFYEENEMYQDFEIITSRYDVTSFDYNHKIFEQFLEDLKHKKIQINNYDLHITVYVSSEVYNQLKSNEEKLNALYDRDYDLEDICYELNNQGYEVPSYCLPYLYEEM